MIKRAKAVTGDRPGVTRGKQWLSIDGVDFLDTPGTLWGKFEDQATAHHLAYIGSIKEEILDVLELSCDFVQELKELAPNSFKLRYGIDELPESPYETIEEIARKRGFKLRADTLDVERAAKTLIDDFRKGRLCKIMLEYPKN
nr:ribosome biogenesis GTPase YlqF [Clostridia bacterium]